MLKNGNIELRALEPADLEKLYIWENDSTLWKVSQTRVPFSRDLLQKYIESAQDIHVHGQLRLIIEQAGLVAGAIDLFEYDPINSRVGVGIMIGAEYRNKGIAREALVLVVNYSKEILLVDQLYCNIIENNQASESLFEGAGFKRTGVKENWIRTADGFQSVGFYQLLLNG